MDAATIQARINRGYAIAGGKLGPLCNLYRPADPLAPMATVRATIPAAFDASPPFDFRKPNEYGDARWYGLFDYAQTQPGDYLAGAAGIWLVAALQPLLPALCIQCNRTVSLRRPAAPSAAGVMTYQGVTAANEVVLMAGWPASVLMSGRGERGESMLPGEPKLPLWSILLPAWPGIAIRNGDVIQDETGLRYAVAGAEWTDLGWRLSARLAVA